MHECLGKIKIKRGQFFIAAVIPAMLLLFWFSLPRELFRDPLCTVVEDSEGNLIGARIAEDGQWRFPEADSVPDRFVRALLCFEDQWFFHHPGVNPVSLLRAAHQNIRAGKIVSGGSTLSMQVIRLYRKRGNRNLREKLIEIILALRLELQYSKNSILKLYCTYAPFGGNVVGLEAASWRYFGRSPDKLSWAESATLAVLPNSPSLIYPGRNQQILIGKRNRLLDRLCEKGIIDTETRDLSKLEALPDKPEQLPSAAYHLTNRIWLSEPGKRVRTSLDPFLQQKASEILESEMSRFRHNEIFNGAILIAEVNSGRILAYIGNCRPVPGKNTSHHVDIVTAQRSTGSILKPFLFASLLEDGQILPGSLVADIPTQISGYSPKNFALSYDGAVPARRSLSRSLNVPSVRMLQEYGVGRFYDKMKQLGMEGLVRPASHYGLSIILGGAESSLWEMTGIYAGLSRYLNEFNENGSSTYSAGLRYTTHRASHLRDGAQRDPGVSPASVWLSWEALVEVNRPDEESSWELYKQGGKIAWKTGTSYGNRDAWAIGTTPGYAVGVWIGNASGEGRPGLTGISAAAPLMFQLFGLLPRSGWFQQPYENMIQIPVCRESGFRAGMDCQTLDSMWVQEKGTEVPVCPYHQKIQLSPDRKFRVNSDCESVSNMISESWFVLPPVMEWYYRSRNPFYRPLPPFRKDCIQGSGPKYMDLIYPRNLSRIFIPREMGGQSGKAVFEVTHRLPGTIIFWHLNEQYIAQTQYIHQIELSPPPGTHSLTLVDEHGEMLVRTFTILDPDRK